MHLIEFQYIISILQIRKVNIKFNLKLTECVFDRVFIMEYFLWQENSLVSLTRVRFSYCISK